MRLKLFLIFNLLAAAAVAGDLPIESPESVGMSSERLDRISTYLQAQVDKGLFAGASAMVARKGKVVHFSSTGKQNLETGAGMKRDTLFRIYSMSKPITAVAALILYEEGKFKLNDALSMHIPEFAELKVLDDGAERPPKREPTVQDLMRHTAGFTYANRLYRGAEITDSRDLQEFIGKLGKLPLMYEPGTQWVYSYSSDILGYLVERASGMSFDKFLQQRLFDPLGMADTSFWVPKSKIDRFGTNHRPNAKTKKLEVIDRPQESAFAKETTLFMGGQGLVSTIDDYMRFGLMLSNGGELGGKRILSPKTIELMAMDHLPFDAGAQIGDAHFGGGSGYGFGLGFAVVNDVAAAGMLRSKGEYFWAGAAGTTFWIDPEEKVAGMGFVQLMGPARRGLRTDLRVLATQAIVD